MKRILSIAALILAAGCANVTTMKLSRTADGAISINSGKDVRIGGLSYSSPTGEVLSVTDYSSNANTDAINAQAAREKQVIDAVMNAVAAGMAMGKHAVGAP